MLVEVTYACKMGCTHCLSDCKPDGEHMTLEVFEDVLKFMIKNQIPTWSFSGGEMFEHPDILKMLSLIESYWKTLPIKYPITFATNGRELVRNKKIYHAVSKFLKHCGKRYVMIQVTDDPRFYPDPLTDNEKYWLSKLEVIIDTVPSDQNNKSHCLYPQGRALKNYSDEYWNTIAPKCINCILITKQKPEATLKDLVNILLSNGKVCTPVIAPDGSIKIGESALCPKIASIYDSVPEIMEKIRNAKCRACKIPWEKLKETNPIAYLFEEAEKEILKTFRDYLNTDVMDRRFFNVANNYIFPHTIIFCRDSIYGNYNALCAEREFELIEKALKFGRQVLNMADKKEDNIVSDEAKEKNMINKRELAARLKQGECLEEIFDFTDGQECLIYKGEFEVSDNIIYIPDIYLNKLNLGVVATGENLNDILKNCYTGNDFLKECNGYKNIAKDLFDFVDWQHPNIQDLTDCYDEEKFYNEFGIHFDDLGND